MDLYVLNCFVLFNDMDEKCSHGHIEPVKHNNVIFLPLLPIHNKNVFINSGHFSEYSSDS